MFKHIFINFALNALHEFLTKPDARKFRKIRKKLTKILVSEKTQETIAEIFTHYNDFVDQIEEQLEDEEQLDKDKEIEQK